tara:strand:+ start:1248 stop:3815 length:2568 start_codon:yes stop_codon:yes gene_type:complete
MPHKPGHPEENPNLWKEISQDIGSFSGFGNMSGINIGSQYSSIIGEGGNIMQAHGNLNAPNTVDALPSIPAMSNVGANSFTGIVNWNSIPGGFQPLPQTAGRSKKLYQISQFHGGINQKSSPRDISDNECQEATNVTVSNIGRIKILGDLHTETSTGLTATALKDSDNPSAGYGWFVFKSGYSLASTPVAGDFTINVTQDGDDVQLADNGSPSTLALDIADADTFVAPVYYAAGNGFYACDANFAHGEERKSAILVNREDQNETVSGWVAGIPLINSPTTDNEAATPAGEVGIQDADVAASTHGALEVCIVPGGLVGADSGGTGTWDGEYFFYVSWLFDGGVETGLTAIGTDTFSNGTLRLNPSLCHTNAAPLGGDKRIEGARIYFKASGGTERYLLAELSLADGVKGALDSTFTPWTINTNVGSDANEDVHDLDDPVRLVFENPPEVYTYASLNGYYANEAYSKSPDLDQDDTTGGTQTAGPTAHDVRYKTATVGAQGVVFIGNVKFRGEHKPDLMMYSMPGKPGVFPKFNFFDSPSSDGMPITALVSFQDTILQFKENAMYAINISNPAQFYAEAAFRDCGVSNPCQVFTTAFGVIFANKNGCFIYDGQKVISLTGGKFNIADWGLSETSSIAADGTGVPCVGYDPRSQSIIVLKDIGHESVDDGAWVYSMLTQSWTEGIDFIENADDDTHSNFQISPNGYLSIIQYDSSDPPEAPFTYNIGEAASNVQTITYWTKDFDLGLPSQTKKLFKIYITYKGKADALTVAYGVDGETDTSDVYHFATDAYGGTTDTTPLLDKSSAANLESWHVATLYPDDSAEGKDWKSISLYFNGAVSESFEINDISILYRVRPIK